MSKKLNLKEHISSKEKKQGYVNQMFATIAPRYDFITIFLSLGMDQGWKRKLIEMLELKGDEKALDLACGTGDITFALGAPLRSGEAVGVDDRDAPRREQAAHAGEVADVLVPHDERPAAQRQLVLADVGAADAGDLHFHQRRVGGHVRKVQLA